MAENFIFCQRFYLTLILLLACSAASAQSPKSAPCKSPIEPNSASENPVVNELLDKAYAANQARDYHTALDLYSRVVKLEPNHLTAWNNLGRMQLRLGLSAAALSSLQKQVAINQCDNLVYRNLARAYIALGQSEDAKAACRTQISMLPEDDFCNLALGDLLNDEGNYREAIRYLEIASSIMPKEPTIPVRLGMARLRVGDKDGAYADFQRALHLGPIPSVWIDVSREMSEHQLHPDEATQYALQAIDVLGPMLKAMIQQHQYREAWQLSEELVWGWDAIASAYQSQGKLAEAERYAAASWKNWMFAETGERLGKIYEAMGKPKRALDVYAEVLVRFPDSPNATERMIALVPSGGNVATAVEDARTKRMDVVTLSNRADVDSFEDVWLVLDNTGKVLDVQFAESHSLDAFTPKIKESTFQAGLADVPVLVRRGRIFCSQKAEKCRFALLPGGLNESVSSFERLHLGPSQQNAQ